jgi:hypothetical protein
MTALKATIGGGAGHARRVPATVAEGGRIRRKRLSPAQTVQLFRNEGQHARMMIDRSSYMPSIYCARNFKRQHGWLVEASLMR